MSNIAEILKKNCIKSSVSEREPMQKHTSFRTGGPADYFISLGHKEELPLIIALLMECQIPYYIIGNGTNLLVGDKGIRGAVVQIYDKLNNIEARDGCITAEAGALLSAIAQTALAHSYDGFAFASGIPGSLGGAVCMNAGAYGGEIKQVLDSAEILFPDGKIAWVPCENLKLSYRHSIISEKGWVVLGGKIRLQEGCQKEIKRDMEELAAKRREKQPLNYPSAGSTFKRPEGYFAGKLIADANLKGFSIGGAQVSEKHAGFVINKGGATSADILQLIRHCQAIIKEKFSVSLETEVKILGEF